jgi:hypothetical protein
VAQLVDEPRDERAELGVGVGLGAVVVVVVVVVEDLLSLRSTHLQSIC